MGLAAMAGLAMSDIGGGPIPTVAGTALHAIEGALGPGRAHFVPIDEDDGDKLPERHRQD